MKLSEIAELVQGEVVGDPEKEISGLAKIEEAGPGDLTFIANQKYAHFLDNTDASAVLVSPDQKTVPIPSIVVRDPYLAFLEVLKIFHPPEEPDFKGIHGSAIVSDKAKIEQTASIGPFCFIGSGVNIGKGTILYPGCIILNNVQIGDYCILYPNVSIRENCIIENRVILHNGAVIGSDGFGFAPSEEEYKKIPQMGIVHLQDDVEIGANSTVDRATLGETLIKKGCKIDNMVQIAHNVIIEENTVIAAQSGISGSTKIGKNVTIAGQVGIVGHVKIGEKAIIAAKSGVSKDLPAGEVWFGYPALPIMKQKKIEISLRHLPDLTKKVHSLEKTVIKLQEKLNKLNEQNDG